MEEKTQIQQQLLDIYNGISDKHVESIYANLFVPDVFVSPIDMVYFVDEIEKKYNIVLGNEDIVFEKFCTIYQISQLVECKINL